MKLEETNAQLSFDISSGEDDLVLNLVESFNTNTIDDFVYKNKTLLRKIDSNRLDQFFKIIGESKRFVLQDLHEAFNRKNLPL